MKKLFKTTLEYIVVFLFITLAVSIGTGNLTWDTVKNLVNKPIGSTFNDDAEITLIGSSSNYVSLPNEAVYSAATTTDAGGTLADGGYTLQQDIDTRQTRKVLLFINSQGGTATSTMYIRQMASFDGTNFVDIATTTALMTTASSTDNLAEKMAQTPLGTQFAPGTASTTGLVIPFAIDGFQKTRFVIYADNAPEDTSDGVQAFITAVPIKDTAN